jgi:DNA-binding HxlR family transcriptional regulator
MTVSDDVRPGARTAPAVLRALQEDGPLGLDELRSQVGATARSIDLALHLLREDGRIERQPDGTYRAV